ncbi:MAG: leucine-rich repeat domain-containing protein, partial [Ureaplasma sp.]|nr:leucine-rich repeat domain-containing protein [Ureaplasma sp.]
ALETVKYPNSIPSIPNNTFNGCTSLKNFNFSELTKLTSIGSGAFNNTGLSGSIDLSNCTKLTTIPGSFIAGTQVEEVKVPNTISTISTDAFSNTPNLKTLDLSNLTSNKLVLGSRVFSGAGFDEVDTVQPTGENADSQVGKLLLPANKEILFSNNIFYGMPNLTKAVIGSTSTTNNNSYVASFFSGSSKLKTIDLSKCESAAYILNGTNGSKGNAPSFNGTAINEVKVGNPGNLAATNGQLLLPSTIESLSTNSLNGMTSLTKLDLAAATSLTTIYANISNANISEIVLPTEQRIDMDGDSNDDVILTPADQLVINGSIGSDAQFAANYFANNAVTSQIARWGNVANNA